MKCLLIDRILKLRQQLISTCLVTMCCTAFLSLCACKKRQADPLPVASPQTKPAPALVKRGESLVKRGEYLANAVAACMDCHSRRDFSLFTGPTQEGSFAGGGKRFGAEIGLFGTFYGKNLTPTGLKEWSDDEIHRAITKGIDKEGQPLFPVMPYQRYATLDPQDVQAIIAYLRSLNPHPNRVPPRESKLPEEVMLQAFPHKERPTKRPALTDTVAYGGYLVNTAHCVECHSPRDERGIIVGKAFSGGARFGLPTGTVYSANLTPDPETGLGKWSAEAFVARFKQYSKENYKPQKVEKGGFNTIMPWTQYGNLTEQDLKAIYAYLQSLKPVQNRVPGFQPKAD